MTDLETIFMIAAVAAIWGAAAWIAGGIIERNRQRITRATHRSKP